MAVKTRTANLQRVVFQVHSEDLEVGEESIRTGDVVKGHILHGISAD